MEEVKTTKRTPEAIRMYNDISEDFHVIDVIVDKLSVLREISTTYGENTSLKDVIENLEAQQTRITNTIFTNLEKKQVMIEIEDIEKAIEDVDKALPHMAAQHLLNLCKDIRFENNKPIIKNV